MSASPRVFLLTILWVLLGLNAAGVLLVGLSPRGFEFRNGVEWDDDGSGIDFVKPGLAYTETFATQETDQAEQGLTIQLALRADAQATPGFRFIAVVHSGSDQSQLLIAQWRQTIIVMNGDDYDYTRRLPRLTAAVSDYAGEPFYLVVTSDARGGTLYINGNAVDSNPDLTLRLPTDQTQGRLVLGNSVYGDKPWLGAVGGFALHRVALGEEALRRHLELWSHDRDFSGDDYGSADLSYPLSEGTDRTASDRSLNGVDLHFPRETTFIEPRFFAHDIATLALDDTTDVVINLCGFVPFGFVLIALLAERTSIPRLAALLPVCAIGLALSFGVELAQAWIPSRRSSYLDLLLNVVGTGIGGAAYAPLSRAWQRAAARSRGTPTG